MLWLLSSLLFLVCLGQEPDNNEEVERNIPLEFIKTITLRETAKFDGRIDPSLKFDEDFLLIVDPDTLISDNPLNQDTFESLQEDNILFDVDNKGNQYESYISEEYWKQHVLDEIREQTGSVKCDTSQQQCVGYQDDQPGDPCDQGEPDDPAVRRLWTLGADTRTERTGNPITTLPSRQAGRLTFRANGQNSWCSGVVVGPRHLLTAGHCVHGGRGGSWYSNFRFFPRQNRLDASSGIGWSRIRTFTGWTRRSSFNWDIAIVQLSSDIPAGIGRMPFGWTTTSTLRPGRWIYHRGYPGNKPQPSMWASSGRIWRRWTHQLHTDTTDLWGGTSGGGWWAYPNGRRINYAVTSYGSTTWWGKRFHGHTRITRSKFNSFCNFICTPGICC